MLIRKSIRTLMATAAIAVMSQRSWAACNCSVPPSPAAYAGPAPMAGWSGASGYGMSPTGMSAYPYAPPAVGAGAYNPNGAVWAPGGYEPRIGSPVYYHDPAGGQYVTTGNPYYDHFGPGYHRSSLYGHYRFPYYNYRAPWYYPGTAVYNRDTNFPW